MKVTLSDIRHNQAGFEALARLHKKTQDCFLEDIQIDLSNTSWFDADMCAVFGSLLYHLEEELNTISLTNISSGVESILSKNGFLSHYGRVKVPDAWTTTIAYQRFDVKDDRYFTNYIENQFIHRSEIPDMSAGLLKKFRECIFEIFSNAALHSRTERGIFSCGQFFPTKNKLDFIVADLGVGIRQNIKDHRNLNLSPEEAIVWATKDANTTKRGNIPGGLGLKLLCEFIDLNGGCIQIVSETGYWRREGGETTTKSLQYAFPGTIANIEINTADENAYTLTSERNADDIF